MASKLCSTIPCTWKGGCDAASCFPGGYGCSKPRVPGQDTKCACENGTEAYEHGCKHFQYPSHGRCETTIYYGDVDCSTYGQGCKNPDTEGEFCLCDAGYITREDGSCEPKPIDIDAAAYNACVSIENNEGQGNCSSQNNCVNPTFGLQKYCVYQYQKATATFVDYNQASPAFIAGLIASIGLIISIFALTAKVIIAAQRKKRYFMTEEAMNNVIMQ